MGEGSVTTAPTEAIPIPSRVLARSGGGYSKPRLIPPLEIN